MELSNYNVVVKGVPNSDSCLLFNTRTQALVRLDRDVANNLLGKKFSLIPQEYLFALRKQGFLVEDRNMENKLMEDFFNYISEDMRKIPYEVTILTTYSCNFACTYCFEEDVKHPLYMDETVARAVVDWTVARICERGYKFLFVVFYGGEPFLNYSAMQFLTESFYNEAKKNKFGLGFGMITNGSLLRKEDIVWMKDRGLREIRVTLDGPEDVHNRRRPFKDGRGSFRKIISNLKEIKGLVDIAVSCNFDETTAEECVPLLDVLIDEGLAGYIKYFIFSPVMPRLEKRRERITVGLDNCALLFRDQGLFEKSQDLARIAVDKGFNVRTQLSINLCPMVMRDGAVTIDPLGKLYRCNSFVGFDEFCVGDIFSGWNQKYEQFLDLKPWQKCPLDCPYLPMCQGGCRFFAFIKRHNLELPYCCKEYLDRNISYLIELEYKKKMRKG